ncbi:hypothetical protein CYMTET_44007 [Cymbomonas tetramitiformis]|uniref:Sm domain-containing protein n=1 Tax=Cymbomonas tetramitiformis TaxID=36881 RepID=A0AAE0C2R1_9CHLO|nr:hypothetical protein CYMTET_44007 [Cymbomonas tetramitiformis]
MAVEDLQSTSGAEPHEDAEASRASDQASESSTPSPDELQTSASQPPMDPPVVQRARQLLYRRMKVEVTDGRIMVGNFHCLDKQGNLLLQNTTETRTTRAEEGGEKQQQRTLGLVLVPAKHRVNAFFEVSLGESEENTLLDPKSITEEAITPSVETEVVEVAE